MYKNVSQASSNSDSKLSSLQNKSVKSSSSKENEPRKVLVRNCEVKNLKNIVEYHREEIDSQQNSTESKSTADKNVNMKDKEKPIFTEPRLFTSLKIIESIQNIAEKGSKTIRVQSPPPELGPRTNKALKKVNIPFDEKIYKDLIDLHVNDEDLGINAHHPVKPKEFNKIRDPEPILSDFYKPVFDKEYVVKPNIPKFEIEKVCFHENSSVLKASRQWDPDEISHY